MTEPSPGLIPTINVAEAIGWRKNERPKSAAGLEVKPFASGLDHPRWLYALPNGDVLVAETNAPKRPEGGTTGKLWVVVNERDELGSDLVPDYLTTVKESGFYGWSFSYWGHHVDQRVEPQRPDLVTKAIAPDYALDTPCGPTWTNFREGIQVAADLSEWHLWACMARGIAHRSVATRLSSYPSPVAAPRENPSMC